MLTSIAPVNLSDLFTACPSHSKTLSRSEAMMHLSVWRLYASNHPPSTPLWLSNFYRLELSCTARQTYPRP